MTRRLIVTTLALAALVSAIACSNTPSATVESLNVSSVVVGVNGTQQLVVTALMSDGTSPTVTSAASYASANPAVASVSAAGVVTGVTDGSTSISVTYSTSSAVAGVTVVN